MKSLVEYMNESLNFQALKEKIGYSILFIKSEKKGEAEKRLEKLCKEKYPNYSVVFKNADEVIDTKNDCVNFYIVDYVEKYSKETQKDQYFACIKKDGKKEYAICNWQRKHNTDTKFYLPKISDENLEHALNYGYDCLIGILKPESNNHIDPKYEYTY